MVGEGGTLRGEVPVGSGTRASVTPEEVEKRAAEGVHDPLSRPYTLPSGGVFYGNHDGQVIITPTRGEQEEIIAGASDNEDAYFEAMHHMMNQCVDWRGVTDPLIFDWTAVLIHFLAISQGSDVIYLRPTHSKPIGCGKAGLQKIPLAELPCRTLRRAMGGEEANWPPLSFEEEDAETEILRELEGDVERGTEVQLVTEESLKTPLKTKPLPMTGETVTWRFHRLSDVMNAREFASRMDDSASPGSKRHSFLQAAQITAIGSKRVRLTEAVAWVRKTPSPALNAMREQMNRFGFGYDVTPKFKCPHCGGTFKERIPLDGAMFRSSSSA